MDYQFYIECILYVLYRPCMCIGYVYLHIYIAYLYIYTYYIYIYIYTYVCMYIYMLCVYIYTYIYWLKKMFVGLHARFGEHRNVTFKDHTYMGFLDSLRMVAHIYTWVCMAVRVGWPEGMPVLKGRMLMWIEVRSAVMAGQHQACYCARQPVHRDETGKDSQCCSLLLQV